MDVWENVSCIEFVEQKANEHSCFIRFIALACGCCSHVGKVDYDSRDVSIGTGLGTGCHIKSKILQELGRAIGFHHEQERPDRDEFVSIQTQRIKT